MVTVPDVAVFSPFTVLITSSFSTGGVGKASFDAKSLEENVRAFADAVIKAKPSGAKGNYLKRIALSSTMGPGIKIDLGTISQA